MSKRKNKKRQQEELHDYILLEEMELLTTLKKVELFDQLWNEGRSIEEIQDEMGVKDPDMILIFVIDRARKGKIQNRPGGLILDRQERLRG